MVDSNSALADLGHLIESLPFEYLLIGHCLIVASWFPKLKDRYLLSFWVSPSIVICILRLWESSSTVKACELYGGEN